MQHEEQMPNQGATHTVSQHAPSQQEIDALVALIGARQFAEAEAQAQALTQRFPQDGFAWKALGAALKPLGRLQEAIAAQTRAVSLLPEDASAAYNLGNSFMALGQAANALIYYRQAVRLKPDYAEAHFNLGNALGAQDHLAEASRSFAQALSLRPDFIEAHAARGYTLLTQGLASEAEPHFRRVLASRPNDAIAHNSLGMILRGQGQLPEAEKQYRQAIQHQPNYAEAHSNLGNVLRDQNQLVEAEACYRQAITLHAEFAEPHYNLGNILRDQGRLPEAEQHYRRALDLKPRYFEAHNNLGNCLREQSRLEDACQSFEAAIAIKPEFIEPHCNLAPLKTYRAGDEQVALFEAQQRQLPNLSIPARIRYWFALGKMLEDIGRYDDAFAAYAEGNQLQFQQYPPNEAVDIALLQRMQAVFTAEFFAQRPRPVVGSDKTPIFIVGMPRSGTSLIEQILSTHPGVHGAGELTHISDVIHAAGVDTDGEPLAFPDFVTNLSADALRQLGEQYREKVWQLAPDAERITDKMPANYFHIGMIYLMLPNAKIIHAMRDPMDSCFSCYSRLFNLNHLDFTYDLGSVGRYYVRYIQLMQHWHRVLPTGTVLDIRYEDMVADTEGQARRLLDYLGLPWDERCLTFHQNTRRVRTASVAQVRKPIYQSSVARWMHFEKHLGPLLNIVKDYR